MKISTTPAVSGSPIVNPTPKKIHNLDINSALSRLLAAREAAKHKQATDFWGQCVRDTSGRWSKYYGLRAHSKYNIKYFRGRQITIDYANEAEVAYLRTCLDTRHKFYTGLSRVEEMTLLDFKQWLESLRLTIEYRPVEIWLHNKFSTPAHTVIVQNEVPSIAKKYGDPYDFSATTGPAFPAFPPEALPADTIQDGLVYHSYPTLEYADLYLSHALGALKQLLKTRYPSTREYIYEVAVFFQILINLHYFAAINASLYMNMANGLLEIADINGIEHGIIDFVALRLQPDSFQEYFYDEVMRGQLVEEDFC